MRKIMVLGLAVALVTIAAGCARKSVHLKGGELKKVLEREKIDKRYITAIGIGAADQTLDNKTQRMSTSRDAAIVKAQYELATMINGVRIEGGITVEKAIESGSILSATVDSVVKGAEIIKTEWTDDDGCIVTLRIDLDGFAKGLGVTLVPEPAK